MDLRDTGCEGVNCIAIRVHWHFILQWRLLVHWYFFFRDDLSVPLGCITIGTLLISYKKLMYYGFS